MTTFQDVSWLVQVALFCASLLVVLAWLVQFSLALLRPRWCTRVQGKRDTPWQLPLSLTHQTLTGGVWGSLLRLRLGRDGAGSDTEAGVKGLLSSLFAFKSFREHWQRAWVRALNEQACRQGEICSAVSITHDRPQSSVSSGVLIRLRAKEIEQLSLCSSEALEPSVDTAT
ncbi:Phospholipid transfer protein C2CD2L [Labeo rohita]|uniref:Phospholipid transfer protein C2CD2L n=1 Tax=Labeo rohita TaxID=84645 RepID=A0ABQ8MPA6_LABRO|nr:Phospholipid transfer protein C2CD2L [Labeo rohita]